MSPASRIMLPYIDIVEAAEEPEKLTLTPTSDFLPFIIEELIATGSTEIVIKDAWRYRKELETMPAVWRPYVRLHDVETKSSARARFLMEPVFSELGITLGERTEMAKPAMSIPGMTIVEWTSLS
jgi:hypothetical protein